MSITISIVEYKIAKFLGNVKEIYFEKKEKCLWKYQHDRNIILRLKHRKQLKLYTRSRTMNSARWKSKDRQKTPLKAWKGREDSRKLRLPDVKTIDA
jgi:hypothetical protein